MAALTALAMALGAASSVAGVINANKARKDAKAQTAKNETAAKEAAALEAPIKNADPNFQLGTDDPASKRRTSATRTGSAVKPSSAMTTGGVSASAVGGL